MKTPEGSARLLWRSLPIVLTIVAAWTTDSWAFSTGINGFSGNPATQSGNSCNVCHSGGITPGVVLSGPTQVEPSSTHLYSLEISGGQQISGGLDVSADAGTLMTADAGTQLLSGEITHTSPRSADLSGRVNFSFDWQAPATPGTYTLYGAGLSADSASGNIGDLASTDTLVITVACSDVDGDGICDAVDVCPLDPANDADGDGICGNADPELDLADLILDTDIVLEACFSVSVTNVRVTAGTQVTFRAGVIVILDNGFQVESGAEVGVEIEPAMACP